MTSPQQRNSKLMAPCWKCRKRQPGCHGSCAAYKQWAEKTRRINDDMRLGDEVSYLIEKARQQKKEWRR